jgi:hypothetical protein
MWYQYVVGLLAVGSGAITGGCGLTCLVATVEDWGDTDVSGLILGVCLLALGGLLFTAGVQVWP